MLEVDNTTSHPSESSAEAHGDARIPLRSEQEETMKVNNPTPEVSTAPDASTGSPGAPSESSPAAPQLEPLVLQPELQASGKEQYHIAELLRYHDQHFVESVYLAILGRKSSDAERARELAELRGRRAGKVEIIERLLAAQEKEGEKEGASPARRVRIEGLPSPVGRRLSRVPVLGYALRLGRAILRLPVLMQHQQQFEFYALAQQQRIADYVNHAAQQQIDAAQQQIHAAQQQIHAAQQQIDAARADLTQAITGQQQSIEWIKREQHTLADAQQEFLIHEQHVIVETQKVVLEELREELRTLSQRQESVRTELDAEVHRLQSLVDADRARPPNSSNQI